MPKRTPAPRKPGAKKPRLKPLKSPAEYQKFFEVLEDEFHKVKDADLKLKIIERAGPQWDDECARWMNLTNADEKAEFATNVVRDANNYLNAFNRLVSPKMLKQIWDDMHDETELPDDIRDHIMTGLYALSFGLNLEVLVACRRAGLNYSESQNTLPGNEPDDKGHNEQKEAQKRA